MKLPLVFTAAVVCAAFARDASSAATPTPSYGSLPAGEVSTIPATRDAPASVGANERVAGFYLAEQGGAARMARSERQTARWSFLFGNPDDARQFRKNQGGAGDGSVCFTTAEQARMFTGGFIQPGEAEPDPIEWPSWFESRPSFGFDPNNMVNQMQRSPGISRNGLVVAVHAERLVRGAAGHAMLVMTDAWVDRQTRGVRLIGSSELPLVSVATGPSGIEVYAARGKGGAEVVVTGPTVGEGFDATARNFARQFSRLTASLGEGRSGNSDCGHIRVALHPRAEDGPEMAVVQTVALLPPLDDSDDSPAPVSSVTANPAAQGFQKIQAMRKRPLTVSLSATQTSADAEPVLSVAIGWAGREQR